MAWLSSCQLDCPNVRSRDHFVIVPSQWWTTLHCKVVSHWVDAYTKWSLHAVAWLTQLRWSNLKDVGKLACTLPLQNTTKREPHIYIYIFMILGNILHIRYTVFHDLSLIDPLAPLDQTEVNQCNILAQHSANLLDMQRRCQRPPLRRRLIIYSLSLQWRRVGILSNHRQLEYLFNTFWVYQRRKYQKFELLTFCEGNPPVTVALPSQRASRVGNASRPWRHHAVHFSDTPRISLTSHAVADGFHWVFDQLFILDKALNLKADNNSSVIMWRRMRLTKLQAT